MVRIEIPYPTPSLNQIKRMHFRAYGRLRDQYVMLIRAQTSMANRCLRNQFRIVKIDRYGSRVLDHDNLCGGAKPLVDALKRCELIVDDSPTFVTITYNQHKSSRKEARTVVTIKP